MEKLKMHSVDKVQEHIEQIGKLFPNCITERKVDGKVVPAVDFDMLRQELSDVVVEGPAERYQFTWPDKRKSVLAANAPISATLRPVRNDETVPTGRDSEGRPYCSSGSVNFDTTENLYIEGDNLEVLKLLQETYLGKVKMIYIDPPYNTGSDFIYEDDFSQETREHLIASGQYDEYGNRMVKNFDTKGRFHTDWLNMLYPRLKLSKDLLTDDGAIFISIDENEVENLKKICSEIFGSHNFIGCVIWERAFAPKNDAKFLSDSHDYIVIYAKNILSFQIGKLPRSEEANARYKNPDNDPRGPWTSGDLSVKTYNKSTDYPITTPSGRIVNPPHGACWRVSKERFQELLEEKRVFFGDDGNNVPRLKRFLSEIQEGMTPTTIWKFTEVGHNQEGRQELKKLFDDKGYFDGPKPVRLLERVIQIANLDQDSIVLDYFSGSSTTAHSIIKKNSEDNGHRKFIMIQLPEKTDEKSEAYKAGYKNICEIGKERILRAGAKIKAESPLTTSDLDVGFRVLKLDSSNMKDVYYQPEEYEMNFIEELAGNIKEDRTPEDLLFQVMLDLGVLLSSKIEETVIAGKKVFNVAEGYLIACFDSDISNDVVTAIAQMHPSYAVFRDSGFHNDSTAANFEQIFTSISPETERKVL